MNIAIVYVLSCCLLAELPAPNRHQFQPFVSYRRRLRHDGLQPDLNLQADQRLPARYELMPSGVRESKAGRGNAAWQVRLSTNA
jgi:hypothetical protein